MNAMQCGISAVTFEFRDATYPLRITATQASKTRFVDFEMRVAYFGTDRGTRVTQTSIICKCALNT